MKLLLKKRVRSLAKKIVSYTIRWQLTVYLKIQRINNASAFHKVFYKLDNNKLINYFLPLCEHRHQLSNREYLLLEIVKRMTKIGCNYVPEPLFYGHANVIEKIKNQPSLVIATAHNGFAFTTKFVSSLKRTVATIAADSDYVKDVVFKRTGISSEVTIIKRDKFCLARLMEAVKNNNIICCDIDYQKSTHEKFIYVGPALFIFADRNNLPIYFAKYEISGTGDLQILFKEPDSEISSEEKLVDFIDFINSTRIIKKQLFPSKF